jgi:hypothetical protein
MRHTLRASFALLVAIGGVWLIERAFLHVKDLSPTNQGILGLEMLIVSVLLGSFLMGEVARIHDKIHDSNRPTTPPLGLRTKDILNLLLALGGSMTIYVVSVHFLK